MDYTWQYYDLLLAAIAASMLLGLFVGLASSVAVTTATTVSGIVAAGFIGIGMFVIAPVDEPSDLAEPVESLN